MPIAGIRKVRGARADFEDRYGDILVDTGKSHEVYKRWLADGSSGPGGVLYRFINRISHRLRHRLLIPPLPQAMTEGIRQNRTQLGWLRRFFDTE